MVLIYVQSRFVLKCISPVGVTVLVTWRAVAFQVRLRLRDANAAPSDQDVLPIEWSDNYMTLLPGETQAVSAVYLTTSVSAAPVVVVETYNDLVTCA